MKSKIKFVFFTMLLCSTMLCMAQEDDETSQMVFKSVAEALLKGDCDKAQRNYNIWKELTGKTNIDIEGEIENCKSSKKDKIQEAARAQGYINLNYPKISVQIKDIANDKITWRNAKISCENSSVGGFNDWRLPSEKEVFKLLENTTEINNFIEEANYWILKQDTSVKLAKRENITLTFTRITGVPELSTAYCRCVRSLPQ